MSDDKPTTPGPEPDETQALPAADETQALPAADETQALPAADETQALPAADETQAFPGSGDTRAFPVAGPDDPLSIFDQPERPAEPAFTEHASTQPAGAVPEPPAPGDGGYAGDRGYTGYGAAAPEPATPEPAAPEPAGTTPVAAAVDEPHPGSGPRASTIVWGFLVVAFGVGLVANAAGAHIDVELAAIVLLAAAGALLVIGSVVSAVRRRRRATTAR